MPPPFSIIVINTSHYTLTFHLRAGNLISGPHSCVANILCVELSSHPRILREHKSYKNEIILPDRWHRTPYLQLSPSDLLENLSRGQHAHEVDSFYQGNPGDPLSMPTRQKEKRGLIISPNFKIKLYVCVCTYIHTYIQTYFCQNHICITWKWLCMQKTCFPSLSVSNAKSHTSLTKRNVSLWTMPHNIWIFKKIKTLAPLFSEVLEFLLMSVVFSFY